MTSGDLKAFKDLFNDYYDHIKKNKNSLLARAYGIYTVKLGHIAPVSLIVMGNTMQLKNPNNLVNVFDLKGSFVNREVKSKNLKPSSTLKDINLLEICKSNVVSKHYS